MQHSDLTSVACITRIIVRVRQLTVKCTLHTRTHICRTCSEWRCRRALGGLRAVAAPPRAVRDIRGLTAPPAPRLPTQLASLASSHPSHQCPLRTFAECRRQHWPLRRAEQARKQEVPFAALAHSPHALTGGDTKISRNEISMWL